ncbi:hypothetical protein IQ215_06960 [Cyanobacterium stanieri LEGE 03274]|uniref:Uncharacterized protein n=1 Tax=Cyanobacterium stanieri LEGE 03274 TaxID=1828756 RepID=A0ABR9V3F9_9CHRO|nr:hypothetical protein [Cyanobacterium stanieri]MBE9222434.1 hypothetical protein [Cyanobacterium stanieri LEGE 03274]
MDSSQQINEALNQKEYKKALLIALSNSLKITLKTSLKTNENSYSITKSIDLVNGSKTHIDSELLTKNNEYIVNFHQEKSSQIYQTWEKNRETLLKAFEIIAEGNINLEPLLIGQNNSHCKDNSPQQSSTDISDNLDDFSIDDEENNQVISDDEFDDFSTDNENENLSIAESEFDSFINDEEEDKSLIMESAFDTSEDDDIEEDEFTQIISPDDVSEASYDDFDDGFEEDSTEENWIDDVVIQDSENNDIVNGEVIGNDYVSTDEEDSEALFEDLGEMDSVDDSQGDEADWGDLLEDSQSNSAAEVVTPSPEDDNIDDWNEWIESQDGGEISCNPEEIDWSEDDWKDTPA